MQEVKEEKKELKTLANCKPSEFLKQTNKIKKSVEKWLKLTDLMNIRNKKPIGIKEIPENASDEEVERIVEENRSLYAEQAKANISEMLDSILDKHPDETIELLALCCFIEPEHADDYPMRMYFSAINNLLNDKAVIDFFSLLMQSAQKIM